MRPRWPSRCTIGVLRPLLASEGRADVAVRHARVLARLDTDPRERAITIHLADTLLKFFGAWGANGRKGVLAGIDPGLGSGEGLRAELVDLLGRVHAAAGDDLHPLMY